MRATTDQSEMNRIEVQKDAEDDQPQKNRRAKTGFSVLLLPAVVVVNEDLLSLFWEIHQPSTDEWLVLGAPLRRTQGWGHVA
jgi:hypothetical protein